MLHSLGIGITPLMSVPPPGRAVDTEPTAEGGDSFCQADQPTPMRAGAPTPSFVHLDDELASGHVCAHTRVAGIGVLDDVRQRLGRNEVRGGFDGLAEATDGDIGVDRDGHPCGKGFQCRRQALREHRWADSAREVP
jgi:hypothetical protein